MVLSENYLNSLCTIKTMQNEILFKGRIKKIGDDFFDIVDIKNEPLPLFAFGVQIKMEIPGGHNKFKILTGKTYISNKTFLRIANPSTMSDYDNRLYFRVKVKDKISVFVPSEDNPDDTSQGEIFDVLMIDLSLGGFQFITDHHFKKEQLIFSTIDIMGKQILLNARVIRIIHEKESLKFSYGCKFVGISERQQDFIYKYLLKKEMEQRSKKRIE